MRCGGRHVNSRVIDGCACSCERGRAFQRLRFERGCTVTRVRCAIAAIHPRARCRAWHRAHIQEGVAEAIAFLRGVESLTRIELGVRPPSLAGARARVHGGTLRHVAHRNVSALGCTEEGDILRTVHYEFVPQRPGSCLASVSLCARAPSHRAVFMQALLAMCGMSFHSAGGGSGAVLSGSLRRCHLLAVMAPALRAPPPLQAPPPQVLCPETAQRLWTPRVRPAAGRNRRVRV